MAIATLPFGRLGHQSTRTLFGAAALSRVSQDDADRTLDVLLQYGVNHIDVAASVREVADLLQPLVEAKKLSLVVDVPQVPLFFPTDGAKFRQIVINLTGNAVKFTSMGEIRLHLAAHDAGVVLRVRDTGEGINAADVERLFESFTQAGPSDPRQSRGTGLGLAISRQLARLLGGDVTVESVPGSGSTFTLRLPYAPEAGAPAESGQARIAFRERRAGARIETP